MHIHLSLGSAITVKCTAILGFINKNPNRPRWWRDIPLKSQIVSSTSTTFCKHLNFEVYLINKNFSAISGRVGLTINWDLFIFILYTIL